VSIATTECVVSNTATDTAATLTMPLVALGARLVALVIAREAGAP